jgi:hypothetical protein
MKFSPKMILTTVFVSALGLAGLTRTTYASELPSRLVVTPQPQRSIEVGEADSPSDRNREVKEDRDQEVKVPSHQPATVPSLNQPALDLANPPAEVPSPSLMRFGV